MIAELEKLQIELEEVQEMSTAEVFEKYNTDSRLEIIDDIVNDINWLKTEIEQASLPLICELEHAGYVYGYDFY